MTDGDIDNRTASAYTVEINWGDGTPNTFGSVIRNGQMSQGGMQWDVFGSHTYTTRPTRSVTLTVRDSGGATAISTSTATVSGVIAGPGKITYASPINIWVVGGQAFTLGVAAIGFTGDPSSELRVL